MWSNQHSWRWKRKIWSSSCLGIRRGGRAWQLHRNKVQRKFCNKNLILFAFYCNKLYILLIRMWNLSSNMQYSFLYYLHPIQNYFICKSWNHCKKGILILRIEKKLIRCGQSFIRKKLFYKYWRKRWNKFYSELFNMNELWGLFLWNFGLNRRRRIFRCPVKRSQLVPSRGC